jgi:hypothetical protein
MPAGSEKEKYQSSDSEIKLLPHSSGEAAWYANL